MRRTSLVVAFGIVLACAGGANAQHGGSSAPAPTPPPPPASESIQKSREATEKEKAQYRTEKARVDAINERVRRYKELMARIPFEAVPNTSNMVQVFMNGHDLQNVARQIYNVSSGASDAGFQSSYWPKVLWLNRSKDYHGGLPQYGKLDPQNPEANVALFPNIRKQGYNAIVSPIQNADSAMALQMTIPVVMAYRKRLDENVAQLAARGGQVVELEGPKSLPGVNTVALFQGLPTEPAEQYPPRRLSTPSEFVSTDPVAVDRSPPLEPMPPAWSLKQGVNMLGPNYEGYNMQYQPNRFDLAPEFAPIGFLGGRDPDGNARIQPGFHFGLNQRFFNWLRVNEAAFVAFSAGDAPPVNGGSLNAGLGMLVGGLVDVSALAGFAGMSIVGDAQFGPIFTFKARMAVANHLQLLGMYAYSTITHYRTVDETGGHTGVSNANYFGLGVVVR